MKTSSVNALLSRRSFVLGAVSAGTLLALPPTAKGEMFDGLMTTQVASAATKAPLIPPVLRSRNELLHGTETPDVTTLPITDAGTTYNLAQEVRWLDSNHFAVGRWDGTMSIFEFNNAPYVGALVTAAVSSPSSGGVQMITPMPSSTIVTSNDASSLSIWVSQSGKWSDLKRRMNVAYDASLEVATSGAWFPSQGPGQLPTLVVGHNSGYISLWAVSPYGGDLSLLDTINLQNPNPVNPFNSHVMYGMCRLISSGVNAAVVCGSDDGYVSIVRVPSGVVLSQTVFNPSAQRGINSVSISGNKLLVSNCSVGSEDKNLWYFNVDLKSGRLTLLDSMNLIIDTSLVQAFNFDTIWGEYSSGACWFAGTEEGALWMGTADTKLHLIGQESLSDGAIGAALAFAQDPGRLTAVIHNIDQFMTGSS